MIVDSEEGEDLCSAEDVSCFPTVKLFRGGRVSDTVEGAAIEDQLRTLLLSSEQSLACSPVRVAEPVVAESESASADKNHYISNSRIVAVNTETDLRRVVDRCKAAETLLVVVS